MRDPGGPLRIGLPEPLDRRMRLGPFPSVRDALKFATYAAVGAVPASLLAPIWWVPFLGGGFLLSTVRSEGKAPDERAGEFVAYHLRRGANHRARPHPPENERTRGSFVRVGGGTLLALLEVSGTPVAFLPPAEARALFDGFRGVLEALEGGLCVWMRTETISAGPLRPPRALAPPAPAARAGYDEMVRLLVQRRRRRQVILGLWVSRDDGSEARLDELAGSLSGQLAAIGLAAERLTDARLGATARRIGWPSELVG